MLCDERVGGQDARGSSRRFARWRALALLAGAWLVAATPSRAQDQAAAPRLADITEYYVEGNTILSPVEIERAVYPFLGPGRPETDVEAARAALERVYQNRGYQTVLVQVPPQTVRGGVVRLLVVEARVGTVEVAGERHVSEARVRRELPSLAPGKVPNLDTLNAELAAFNARSANRQITPEVVPGAVSGTLDVKLSVEDKLPVHGSLELNNQYSRDTSELRVQASVRYEDVLGPGHTLSAFAALAPIDLDDSAVAVLAYSAPVGDRLRFDLSGLVSNSDVATVGSTNVIGTGHSVSAGFTGEIASAPGTYQTWSASAAYKNFEERLRFGGFENRVPIVYFPVSLAYSRTQRSDSGELTAGIGTTFAFRGLGSDPADFDAKRFRATGGFIYLTASASGRQELGGGAELFVSLDGQIASEPLVSNEQLAAGGAGSVRGYLQSEVIGDEGVRTSLELRSPSIGGSIAGWFDDARAILFVDAASLWTKDPLPEQQQQFSLMGAGIGLRTQVFGHLFGHVDLAVPLKDTDTTEAGDPRIHFRLFTQF